MSEEEFAEDVDRSMDAISSAGGGRVIGYRAPEWSIRPHTMWALRVLRRKGIRYDSSMVPLTRMGDRSFPTAPCRIPTEDGEILEFPLTTVRCFGEHLPFTGGLPLRLMPYFYVLSRIRRMNAEGDAAMVYVHPWEFDAEQPRIELPWSRRIMLFFNLRSTPGKFSGLLGNLRFAPLREVLGVGPTFGRHNMRSRWPFRRRWPRGFFPGSSSSCCGRDGPGRPVSCLPWGSSSSGSTGRRPRPGDGKGPPLTHPRSASRRPGVRTGNGVPMG